MVRVMPNQNSVFGLQRAARALFAGIICLLAILCAAGTACAQSADSSSDNWGSSIFSTYGVTIFLVLLLIGLLVFKKVRAEQIACEIANARLIRKSTRPHIAACPHSERQHDMFLTAAMH